MNVTVEWKINFAVILASISLLITIISKVLDYYKNKKAKQIQAYEKLFGDVYYILMYPFKSRKAKARKIEYRNNDKKLEFAVRQYLNTHWVELAWGNPQLLLDTDMSDKEKREFLRLVSKEASRFERKKSKYSIELNELELSPVNYIDNEDIAKRFKEIIIKIGESYSLFSPKVQKLWSAVNLSDPHEVKKKYEQGYTVCKDYYIHNERDFEDPFNDLIVTLNSDYRKLNKPRYDKLRFHLHYSFKRYYRRFRKNV